MIIDPRFNGPPGSGNGGYCSGLFAGTVGEGVAEVTLRRPPPLATPLRADSDEAGGGVRILDGDVLVAEARPADVGGEVAVKPVSYDEARAASATYPGFGDHPFSTCFVCGPGRPAGDGLRVYPGRINGGRTAAVWQVPDEVNDELVWAVLDCPGGWAVEQESQPHVLGRLAARIDSLPAAGEPCVVMGQLLGGEGRKAYTYTSLYGASGDLLATARATWIAL